MAKTADLKPLFRLIISFLVIASLLILAAGELIAGHCDDDCENHCDSSCQDCGDCAQCMRTVPMISVDEFVFAPFDPSPEWADTPRSLQIQYSPAIGIDHPPRNLL